MGVTSFPGNPDITLKLRKNPRAKRMTLRISRIDGSVTLTVPRGVSDRDALAFAEEKQDWVRSHLEQHRDPILVGPGTVLDVAGKRYRIAPGQSSKLSIANGVIELPEPIKKGRKHLQVWLKEQARKNNKKK